jgi:hypothetical protein
MKVRRSPRDCADRRSTCDCTLRPDGCFGLKRPATIEVHIAKQLVNSLNTRRVDRPVDRSPNVRPILLQPPRPFGPVIAQRNGIRCSDNRDHVIEMLVADRRSFVASSQLAVTEVTQRLQQVVAPAGSVGGSVASVGNSAMAVVSTLENRQPIEQATFDRLQQTVRPADRRLQLIVPRRAAASSSANGRPSSAVQTVAMAAAWDDGSNELSASTARRAKSSCAFVSALSVSIRKTCSASIRRGSRLVAKTAESGQSLRRRCKRPAIAPTTCSQLSTTSSRQRTDRKTLPAAWPPG